MHSFLDGRLLLQRGDITQFGGESPSAIVNAANSSLLGGGGVDGAIHRAGGPAILEECRRLRSTSHRDGLRTGQAVITDAGRLAVDHVVHTVGPVWHGGDEGEPELLRAAYRNSLATAAAAGIVELAFPAISTGVFGYPPERAAHDATAEIAAFLAAHQLPRRVHLVLFSQADLQTVLDNIAAAVRP